MESGCVSSRSDAVAEALDGEIKKRGLKEKVCIKRVGCLCSCAAGPMVSVAGEGAADAASVRALYQNVRAEDAAGLVDALGSEGGVGDGRLKAGLQTTL